MAQKILELRRQKAGLVEKARHLLDLVDQEERGMSDQEEKDYDGFMSEIENLDKDIRRREALEQRAGMAGGADPTKPDPDGQPDPKIGMERKDLRNWSLVRAIRAMDAARRGERQAWKGAELELEASQAVAQRTGMEPQGFYVPFDVLESRDLTKGTATAGGHTVATDLLAQSFIELLRNRLILNAVGATMLTGLVGDIAIPRQTSGATAYWVGEGSAPTESQQAVDQVTMTPHTAGAFTDYSRKLMKQSSIDVEAFVRNDLAAVLGLAIDYAGLHGDDGSDANQPDGLAQLSGIGSVVGGDNGAAPTWLNLVALETEVTVDNADVGRLAYLSNAKVRGKLKGTPRTATCGDIMIWETNAGNTPVNGYPFLVSNQVASDLDKGSASGVCSAIFFGNWADMIIGMWGGLDIMVDPYTHSTSGTMRVVALQDVDFAFRHAQSFAAMLDALTS